MTFVVPFDGSKLAEAALIRAVSFGTTLEEPVVAVTVVPERKRYAREKDWIAPEEPFDVDTVVDRLRDRVRTIAPEAAFEYERIREFPPEDRIATHVEDLLREQEPTVVFLGSDNVGRIVTPLASVGAHVAADVTYDVYLVRGTRPPRIEGLK